jgi:hypothetical protein
MSITTILNPVHNDKLNQKEKSSYDDNIIFPTVTYYTNDNAHIMLTKRIKIKEKTPILSVVFSEASLKSNIYPGLDNLEYYLNIKNLNKIYNKSVNKSVNKSLIMNDKIAIYSDVNKFNYSTVKTLKSNQDIFKHIEIHNKIQSNIVSYLDKNILNISNKWTIMFLNKYVNI